MRSLTTAKALCMTVLHGRSRPHVQRHHRHHGISGITALLVSRIKNPISNILRAKGLGACRLLRRKRPGQQSKKGKHLRATNRHTISKSRICRRRIDIPEQVSPIPRLLQDRSRRTSADRRNGRRGRGFTQASPKLISRIIHGFARHHASRNDPDGFQGPR